MLEQMKVLNQHLHFQPASNEIFTAAGELDVDSAIDLYRINQREGKYKALQKFYKATEKVMGPEKFRGAALAFIKNFPSPDFTLSAFHPKFPGFLAANFKTDIPYIFDLAAFEWHWHRLSHSQYKDDVTFDFRKLQDAMMSDPGKVRFQLSNTANIRKFEHNVGTQYRKILDDQEYEFTPVLNYLMFYRSSAFEKKRRPLKLVEAKLLRFIGTGKTLGESLKFIAATNATESLSKFLHEMIQERVIIG